MIINLKKENNKLRAKKILFYGFLGLYVIILTYLCYKVSPWEDEFYTLNTTSRSLKEVISQSYHFEAQPPLYFILLKFWRMINDSIFFARLFSFGFILLAGYFITKIDKLVSQNESFRWLLIIFLLNPFTIWASIEMRDYGMVLFVSTISIYFFLQYFLSNKKKYLYFFLIAATAGIYTQYLFVFLIIAISMAYLFFKGFKSFFILCLYLIPVVVLFLPNLFFLSDDIAIQQTNSYYYPWGNTIYMILRTPAALLFGLNSVPFQTLGKLLILFIFIFFACYAYYSLYKKNLVSDDPFWKRINFILISAIIFVIIYILAFTVFKLQYTESYMAIAFPLFLMLITILTVCSYPVWKTYFTVLSLYFIVLVLLNYKSPVKFYDFRSIANYVNKTAKSEEPILFYRNTLSLPFEYYYKGKNPLFPLPGAVTFDKNYLINLKDTSDIRHSIERVKTTSDSYILISDDLSGYLYSVNMNRKMVDEYLTRNYRTTLDTMNFANGKDIYIRIRRLERIHKN